MSLWTYFIKLLHTSATHPSNYGIFHLTCLALTIAVTVLFCYLHKKGKLSVRRLLLVTSLLVLFLEILKQISFTFSIQNGEVVSDFQWYAFPFQFCSTPMYVGLFTACLKKSVKIREALLAYLATYAIFGGACVMFYPTQVFLSEPVINIQTMICHGLMIAIGIYLLYSGHVKLEHKTALGAMAVFAVLMGIAFLLNEGAVLVGIIPDETFNMFFISRHFETTLPVFSLVWPHLPYAVSLIVYFVCFSLVAYLILLAAIGIRKLATKKTHKESI